MGPCRGARIGTCDARTIMHDVDASMGPCRGARIGRFHVDHVWPKTFASMGPCRGARIGDETRRALASLWQLQWGRAGGHGSGCARSGPRREPTTRFNGAVPGGTDRALRRENHGRLCARFNGAVPGGTDRGGRAIVSPPRWLASMGPCRGARIGQQRRPRADLALDMASMGPCRGARIGEREGQEGEAEGAASMGPCRGARIGRARAGADAACARASMGPCRGARIGEAVLRRLDRVRLLQWGRAGGHGSGNSAP